MSSALSLSHFYLFFIIVIVIGHVVVIVVIFRVALCAVEVGGVAIV